MCSPDSRVLQSLIVTKSHPPGNAPGMTTRLMTKDELRETLSLLTAADLDAVNHILRRQLKSPTDFVQDVCSHVARYQGKQIRPILVMLSARAVGIPESRVMMARTFGAVVEMIHTATLVHDDVIDDADMRRHVSTVHRRWNTETSVLLGDYLFSRAFHLAATTGDAGACALIGRATDRTCEGELKQIAARLVRSESEMDYFRIIAGKTGHLFAVSCLLGGRAGGADHRQSQQLKQFGLRLGMAFQIADDLLDLTQSEETTGKDEANDLQNGRLTLPLIRAFQLGNADERRIFRECLTSENPDERDTLRQLPMIQRGADSARLTAEELIDRAVRNLMSLPESPERSLLESIARFAVARNH
jgi:octaprenyl-diphosphate synthase